ncbi:MAG: hypothetical protein ACTSVR_05460 [Candidatus Thorarchaeota archaeon]
MNMIKIQNQLLFDYDKYKDSKKEIGEEPLEMEHWMMLNIDIGEPVIIDHGKSREIIGPISAKPIKIPGRPINQKEFNPEGPFEDGKTLKDIPVCCKCGNEHLRYWIAFPRTTKYYCGDCEQSDLDVLQELADKSGLEVGEYHEQLFAVEMEYEAAEADTRTWLIRAHNMAQAIEHAQEGEYEHEIIHQPWSMCQGNFTPIGIEKATEKENEMVE